MSSRFWFSAVALLAWGASISTNAQEAAEGTRTVVPPGKTEAGQLVFVGKGCHQCHSAGATKLPPVDLAQRLVIELGGDVHSKWTRDDYARAIMDPNHLVSEDYKIAMIRLGDHFKAENSPMPTFADVLRVNELIDLVTFLDSLTD
jgi:hypothetical protein